METRFLTPLKDAKGKEGKYSPAEMHLAGLLRNLKSDYVTPGDYDSFERHMSEVTDGKCFTKAECRRLWKALHTIAITYDSIEGVKCFDSSHRISFPNSFYRNNSNFFENYAKEVLLQGDIVQRRGRVKGKIYPDTEASVARMLAAKKAKKNATEEHVVEQVENGIRVDGHFYEDIFRVEPPKEEEAPAKTNLFDGLSLDELREAQNQLAEAILAAQAEEKRRADIRQQYETLRAAADKLLAENPWLDQQ